MNRKALDRARARSLDKTRATRPTDVGRNPAARSLMPSHPMAAGVVRRSRALPMTGAQKNSVGRRSEWNDSVDYFTDPKWGKTVSDGINP